MRSPCIEFRLLSVVRGAGLGGLSGIGATGAMYAIAALALVVGGAPASAWSHATELGFGGNLGSFLELSGPGLHVVHGLVIGAVVGLAVGAFVMPRHRMVTATFLGLLLGAILWLSVISVVPSARSGTGPGPPIVLSFLMHEAFGWVLSVGVVLGRSLGRPASE